MVRNLNLYDTRVVGGNSVGILAGTNDGSTIASGSVVGTVAAANVVGGLAGQSASSLISNSNAVGTVSALKDVGGLVSSVAG